MMNAKMRILLAGIRLKLVRGEKLEDVLTAYPNLTRAEKNALKAELEPTQKRNEKPVGKKEKSNEQ